MWPCTIAPRSPIRSATSRSSRRCEATSATVSGARIGDRAAVERVRERRRVAGAAGELDGLPAQRVAPVARWLVAERRRRAGRAAARAARRLVAERGERLLEQRHEPVVVAGARLDDPPAVPAAARASSRAQPEAPRDAGRLEERLLRAGVSPARASASPRASSSSQRARSSRRPRSSSASSARLVQPRGLLVGEQRERPVAGAPGVARRPCRSRCPAMRVVGELGEVRAGSVAVQRLERLAPPAGAAARGGRS